MPETILVIDDEQLICWSLRQEFERGGFVVLTAQSAAEGIALFREHSPDVVFLDVKLPEKNGLEVLKEMKFINNDAVVIMITAFSAVETAVLAIKNGAYDYIEKPFEFENVKMTVDRALENIRLKREVKDLRKKDRSACSFANFITRSANMKKVLALAKKVAETDYATVLIQGESGTGKDLLAKIIHNESSRAAKPFVEISCSALPDSLIESELFGFEKGSFTDAKNAKKGLFEMAEGGTVYMDEIGDVKLPMQVKLLRVLEEKTFKHIGGNRSINVDFRIIAATNRDLEHEVAQGNFREDLFYRLKVLPIYIPPLRERKDDVVPIAENSVERFNREFKKDIRRLSKEAEEILKNYHWPGNVRQLRNIIEHVMILSEGDTILPEHLPLELRKPLALHKEGGDSTSGFIDITVPDDGIDLAQLEKEILKKAIEKAGGNQTRAAKMLCITRDVLRYRLQKHNL